MARPKPPEAALLATPDDIEHQFYDALQRGDIERLMSVWSDEDDITCVHPGGPRVNGAAAIRSAFEAMFANGAIDAHPEKVRRIRNESSAVHSVLERIQVLTDEGPQVAWVLATNVYLKTDLGWRLVAHHASPGTASELPEIGDPPSVLH
ncbi:nuclear transport factor 2 family protein [Rhizobacter sp. Root1221]|uniref:YybH family protein n=1 Tax=Rhizobacter sp. Root1221 TaxID=1736433 RepID=UPI0006F8107E|nr:nuclear transport factor 2 family protein [Rhizobacter sp. Root1221]KQV99828.1 ketosteroid isomerase [Rhizobacter sp. Root1221]